MDNLSITIEKSLEELNQIIEKINQKKEVIIIEIQKFFTKIRNKLNEREDEILLEVDKQFNEQLCDENEIKKVKKLPDKIKVNLKKGKLIEENWNDNELNKMIYNCIELENNINEINTIYGNIKKCESKKEVNLDYILNEKEIFICIKQLGSFNEFNQMNNQNNMNPMNNSQDKGKELKNQNKLQGLVDKNILKEENFDDFNEIKKINSLKVLQYELKKVEDEISKIDGKVPADIILRKFHISSKIEYIQDHMGEEGITANQYYNYLRQQIKKDQLLLKYFQLKKEQNKIDIVENRIVLMVEEISELEEYLKTIQKPNDNKNEKNKNEK